MWSRDQIDRVRSSIDMVDVIREYVPSLTVRGRSVKGLCPFHHEKTPSFHVHPEKGLFKCFGCGEAGDVIRFFSKIETVGFGEAVERLAQRAGIPLKREKSFKVSQEESVREKCHRALEAAKNFYVEALWNHVLGKNARAYLEERHISDETAQEFQLGYAPDRGGSAFEALIKKGFSIDVLSQVGLVSRSQAGKYFDPLFGRLIFPIFDSFGHVVGFGGRILPSAKKKVLGLENDSRADDGPKYINSPESPVFSKGRLLYGLNQAKTAILEDRRVVILEGYMDVIGVHQAGFKGAVATLGTAFTKDHAKLIKRYADEVVSYFDPDEAGRKAGLRGLEPMIQENLFPRMVNTDQNCDPDELVIKEGVGFFKSLIESSPDFVDYLIEVWKKKGNNTLQAKTKMAEFLVSYIQMSSNEILKAEWTKKVAGGLAVTKESLDRELGKKQVVESDRPPLEGKHFLPTAEEELLQLMMSEPRVAEQVELTENDFIDERVKALYHDLKKQMAADHKISIPAIYDQWPEHDRVWLMKLTLEDKIFSDPDERAQELVQSIRNKKDMKRLTQLSQMMARSDASVEDQNEYRELLRQLKGSQAHGSKVPMKN